MVERNWPLWSGPRLSGALTFLAVLSAALVVLALPLAGAADVRVAKNVTGDKIVDFGSGVRVSVSVSSAEQLKLERLDDPVPEAFSALNYPSFCAFSPGALTCMIGVTTSNLSFTYDLVAVGAGQKVVFLPARISYTTQDGLSESRSSNEIDGFYYVGRSLINTSVSVLEVDGQAAVQAYALPGSRLRIGITARNAGALSADAVALSLKLPAGWTLSSGKVLASMQTLAAGDSGGLLATVTAPSVGNFSEGIAEFNYTATWVDAGRLRSYSAPLTVLMQMPALSAKRTETIKWRKAGNAIQAVLETEIILRNAGSAEASVSLQQEVPPVIESSSIVASLKIPGGSEQKLRAVSVVSGEKVAVPAGTVVYTDALGNKYDAFKFPAEEVRIEKSLWATVYQMTQKWFPLPQIASLVVVLAIFAFFATLTQNGYLLLAAGAVLLLAVLVLVSTAMVWFGL